MRCRWPLTLVLILLASQGWAEPDPFGLGTGKNGPLTVSAANTVVDRNGTAADREDG
jgi:hypothetical protein